MKNKSAGNSLGITLEELWKIVRSIPRGKVMSYGDVGRMLKYPASGFMVGKWMASAPEGVPWWRVLAKDGSLSIAKRSTQLAIEQEQRLKKEGIEFLPDGRVDMEKFSFRIPQL